MAKGGWIRALSVLALGSCVACSQSTAPDEYSSTPGKDYDPEKGEITPTGQALEGSYNGTVAEAAASSGCTTTLVAGLSTQIVQVLNCLHPNSFVRVPERSNLELGDAVFPYLQTPARDALLAALDAKPGSTLHVSSMLRTVAQQYLLFRWSEGGRCGIGLAARPGHSNHESGVALDTGNYSAWRKTLESQGFSWYGSSDAVHFDYEGGGTVDIVGEDVRAFQLLWNSRHPTDTIEPDGLYGPATEKRLRNSPAAGFDGEINCNEILGSTSSGGTGGSKSPPAADDPNPSSGGSGGAGGSGGSGGQSASQGPGGSGGSAGSDTTDGCGSVTLVGVCDNDLLTFCEAGELKSIDCSASDASCGWNSSAGYYDCLSNGTGAAGSGTGGASGEGGSAGTGGTSGSACGSVTFAGECSGDTLSYCDNGNLVVSDCSAQGLTCDYNTTAGYYDCLSASQGSAGSAGSSDTECGSIGTEGECFGAVLQYCSSDKLVTVDCQDSAKVCGWNSNASYYDCL